MNLVSRRNFMKLLAGSAGSLALSQVMSPSLLLAQTMSGGTGRNFIVFNLSGGADGLSLTPYSQGPVADLLRTRLRRTVGIAPGSIYSFYSDTGNPNVLGLHPSLAKLGRTAGQNLKVIQKYGILSDPGRSHDTCQILFSLGRSSLQGGDVQGVLARLMDQQHWESFQYWAIGNSPSQVDVNTRNAAPIILSELKSFNYGQLGAENDWDLAQAAAVERQLLAIQNPRNAAGERYKTALQTMHNVVSVLRSDIAVQKVGDNAAGSYSKDGIGPNVSDAAKVLKAKSVSREFGQQDKDTIIYLNQGSYDTHSDQLNTSSGLPALLADLGDNLAVLVEDLKINRQWDRTVILVFSEFGRTNFENKTGTDHGWGSNTFVLGGGIRAGVLGDAPSTAELLDEDTNALVPTTDFRRIWGDILGWLGVDPSSILDEPGFSYSPLGIFA